MANVVRYQIISGNLYRSSHCPFPARCYGIERFVLKIAHSVDDVDFVVNVYDQPLLTRSGKALPLFTFSKPSNLGIDKL